MTRVRTTFSSTSFLIGLLVGAILMQLWMGADISLFTSTPSEPAVATSTPTKQPDIETGAVSVANQSSGMSVLVDSVTVPPPGVWVAVREIDGNELGNVLGAVRVSGPRSNVTVPLLRQTMPDERYAIELYRDDGTGVFKTSDSVYVDFATGAPVIVHFSTTK